MSPRTVRFAILGFGAAGFGPALAAPILFEFSPTPGFGLGDTFVIGLALYPFAFGMSVIWGIPAALLAQRYRAITLWTAVIAGFLGGAFFDALISAPRFWWGNLLSFALCGMVSAILFFLVFRLAPAPVRPVAS